MSKIKKLVNKHFDPNSGRATYFLEGAWITALSSVFGWWGILVGVVLSMSLSVIKEKFLDKIFNWHSILATFLGCCSTTLIYLIIAVFLD